MKNKLIIIVLKFLNRCRNIFFRKKDNWDSENNTEQAQDSSFEMTSASGTFNMTPSSLILNSSAEFNILSWNGQNISIILNEETNSIEINMDTLTYETIVLDKKIIIKKISDEENYASQYNRTHKQSTENCSYSMSNVLFDEKSPTITWHEAK